MKKIKLINFAVMLGVSSVPLTSLVACNKDNTKDVEFVLSEFLIEKGEKSANIKIDWEPTDAIEFDNDSFEFKYDNGKVADVIAISEATERPFKIQINFSEPIVKDITDGILNFHYENRTAKKESSVSIENIVVKKIDIILDQWNEEKQCLLKSGVPFVAGETYCIYVDWEKFESEPYVPDFSIGVDCRNNPISGCAYYAGERLPDSKFYFEGYQEEKGGEWITTSVFLSTVDKLHNLYFDVAFQNEVTSTWISLGSIQ